MPVQDSLPGKLGPYRILQKIGAGGMGVVYLARDAEGRSVAIKALGPAVTSDPNARRRLLREVETMRRVRSPYVAEIVDADVAADSPYIVTRYVPGRTLEEVVRDSGPLSGRELAGFAAGLAEALTAIHAAGVVHRDLKPGNVMIVDGRPVVIDFGIAHLGDATRLTQTGMVMGTPGYLAPEVIEGQPSSGASDVHSWGGTVAYAALGKSPYGVGTYQTIFYRVVTGKPDLSGIPQPLGSMVAAALAVNPADRPPPTWLAGQCAALANGVIPNGVPLHRGTATMNGAGPNGTLLAPAAGSTLLGPRYTPGPPSPREAARDVADLLPPASQRGGVLADPRAGSNPRAGTALLDRDREGARDTDSDRPDSFGPVIGAIVVIAVALSVLLPVAGTILALVVITLLRAADYASSALVLRRSSRGVRPSDVIVMVVSAPWTMVRALLTTVMLAPIAFFVGVAAAIASVIVLRTHTLAGAGAWAAGAVVAMYCAGPGSKRPRRQLGRVVGTMVRSKGVFTVAVIATWALAAAVVLQATSQPPLYWPADTVMMPHIPSLGTELTHVVHSIFKNTSSFVPHVNVPRFRMGTFRVP
ncbi:MAG: serine/threonine-protein kinase [Streptosporangiaceae bacterium]|jgi:predicted Ser/Thr protein kinase